MLCSACGAGNRDDARFCEVCGRSFAPAGVAAPPVLTRNPLPPAMYPPPIAGADPRMRGGAQMAGGSGSKYAYGKLPVIALLLSFFAPAGGQLYNGDVKKGVSMIAGLAVSLVLTMISGGLLSILCLGVWIWSLVDAYQVADRKSPLW